MFGLFFSGDDRAVGLGDQGAEGSFEEVFLDRGDVLAFGFGLLEDMLEQVLTGPHDKLGVSDNGRQGGWVFRCRADAGIGRQLTGPTTSAGFPGEFRPLIADSGLIHIHKVGSTRQAIKAEHLGVDVVIASGYEMGGHTHAVPMHTFVLVPNVTEAVSVPVLLSGGARDGRTLAAALCLGAAGVAMGTRFIASEDNADWHPATARRIVEAGEGDDTIFPGVYSPARGLKSAGLAHLMDLTRQGATAAELLEYKDAAMIRAEEEGDLDSGILPAGQVACGIRDIARVAQLVPTMAAEAAALLSRLASAGQATTAG